MPHGHLIFRNQRLQKQRNLNHIRHPMINTKGKFGTIFSDAFAGSPNEWNLVSFNICFDKRDGCSRKVVIQFPDLERPLRLTMRE